MNSQVEGSRELLLRKRRNLTLFDRLACPRFSSFHLDKGTGRSLTLHGPEYDFELAQSEIDPRGESAVSSRERSLRGGLIERGREDAKKKKMRRENGGGYGKKNAYFRYKLLLI